MAFPGWESPGESAWELLVVELQVLQPSSWRSKAARAGLIGHVAKDVASEVFASRKEIVLAPSPVY